jgi:hypothetical protein
VEIIVFSRPGAALGTEHWPTEAVASPAGRELVPWRGFNGDNSVPFQRLPASALQMKRDFERMKASTDLHPLLHTGWLQPGLAKEDAVAVRLRSEPDSVGSVDGTIRLVLSRYLHLETNLTYHREGDDAVYQMVESRRMRSKEYHYLDHPAFGVVALVTPVESGKSAAKPAQQ